MEKYHITEDLHFWMEKYSNILKPRWIFIPSKFLFQWFLINVYLYTHRITHSPNFCNSFSLLCNVHTWTNYAINLSWQLWVICNNKWKFVKWIERKYNSIRNQMFSASPMHVASNKTTFLHIKIEHIFLQIFF